MAFQDLGRLVAAAAFLTVWLARRADRAYLLVGLAHLSCGLMGAAALGKVPADALATLLAVGPGLYVGLMLMATEQVRHSSLNTKGAWAFGSTLVALLLILLEIAPEQMPFAATSAGLVVSAALARSCWRNGGAHLRRMAGLAASQELLAAVVSVPALAAGAGGKAFTLTCILSMVMVTYELMSAASTPAIRNDEQTGLPSRGALLNELQLALQTLTPGSILGVVVADIGGLGRMNGLLGQAEGEKLLVMTGDRLKGLCEPGTTIARTGAAEFTFLVRAKSVCGSGPIERLADRVVAAMRQPIGARGRDFFMRARVGVQAATQGANAEELLRLAGLASTELEAMDGWSYFDAKQHERLNRRMAIESGIRDALLNDEFSIVYQPIVCAESKVLCKAEALIRWKSGHLGDVSPAEFIPIAESTGQIVDIGRWVLAKACMQCASWRRQYAPHLVVSVNVAAAQLQQVDFLQTLQETLECLDLPPSALELELTEGALPLDSTSVERTLAAVRALGVRLALDDFGTGYSSLSRLAKLEFDTLKIDRSFVRDIETSERARRLCEFACTLGRQMDLQVVAEGVETEVQSAMLLAFGVDRFQGYLYGRPMPAEVLALSYTRVAQGAAPAALVGEASQTDTAEAACTNLQRCG